MWLARLTEMGLLRASFVPPKAIRTGGCGRAFAGRGAESFRGSVTWPPAGRRRPARYLELEVRSAGYRASVSSSGIACSLPGRPR